jgi:hypothetical protein
MLPPRFAILPKQRRKNSAALLKGKHGRASDAPASFEHLKDPLVQRTSGGVGDRPGTQLLHDNRAHISDRRIALQKGIQGGLSTHDASSGRRPSSA